MNSYRSHLVILSILLVVFIVGCQTKNNLKPFLAPDETSYSVFFIVDDEMFVDENKKLSRFFNNHLQYISQLGVLKASDDEAKIISSLLNLKTYPSYILFNSKEALVIENKFETFEEYFNQMIN